MNRLQAESQGQNTLRLLEDQPGGLVYVAAAPIWDSGSATLQGRDHLLVAITPAAIGVHLNRGGSYHVGQLYGVVSPGLIFAQHLFKGLKRAMLVGGDCGADRNKLAATWTQSRDARLVGPAHACDIEYSPAPADRVFGVYISPNGLVDDFPSIYGWMEHWTWIASDPETPGAPVDWQTRFDDRLWVAP
jgi:hypothetical protein